MKSVDQSISLAKDFLRSGNFVDAYNACEKVLQIIPNHALALHITGICLIRLNRYAEAISFLMAAGNEISGDVNIWLNLALAQQGAGCFADAEVTLKHALALNPNHAVVYNNLAVVQEQMGKKDESLKNFFEAVKIFPNRPEYLSNLGNSLCAHERYGEAIEVLTKARSLAPHNVDIQLRLGKVLAKIDNDQAINVFNAVLKVDANNENAHFSLAHIFGIVGKFEEAEKHLWRVIEINPKKAEAYKQLVHLRPLASNDLNLAANIEGMLQHTTDISASDQAELHFALGKFYDIRAEFDSAFSHYKKANLLSWQDSDFDRERLSMYVDVVISTFTSEFFATFQSDNKIDRPIIICGLPRSGTTLTEQILASHSLVYGAGELPFWENAISSLMQEEFIDNDWVIKSVLVSLKNEVVKNYLATLDDTVPKSAQYVTDKMPTNFLYLGFIHLVLPEVKIIHCKRHLIDNALSIFFLRFAGEHPYAYDLDDLVFFIDQYQKLMRHWRKVLPRDRFYEIQYEDVVNDLESSVRKLINYVGLPWDDACLEFYKTKRPIRTASKWQVRQPIYDSSVGRWKNYKKYLGPLLKYNE